MKRLTLILLLGGCAQGAQQDLPYIKQARSAAAEWALINDQATQGHLTAAYIKTMREEARDEITTASAGLSQPDSAYALQIKSLAAEPDDATPKQLRAKVEALKHIEDSLEST